MNIHFVKKRKLGEEHLGCSSVSERLFCLHEPLGSAPSTDKYNLQILIGFYFANLDLSHTDSIKEPSRRGCFYTRTGLKRGNYRKGGLVISEVAFLIWWRQGNQR